MRELLPPEHDPRGTIVAIVRHDGEDYEPAVGIVTRGWATDDGEDVWEVLVDVVNELVEVPAGYVPVVDDERVAQLRDDLERHHH